MNEDYTSVPIVQVLANSEIFKKLSMFLKVSEKIMKLNFPQESFEKALEKLKEKGFDHVYLTQEDLTQVLTVLNSSDKKGALNEKIVEISRDFIKALGITRDVMEAVKTANSNIQLILGASPEFHTLVKRFKKKLL